MPSRGRRTGSSHSFACVSGQIESAACVRNAANVARRKAALRPRRNLRPTVVPQEKTDMISKFALSAALFFAAAPALAQAPAGGAAAAQPPQPSPAAIAAIQQAAQIFGTCVSGGMQSVPASATPEAG